MINDKINREELAWAAGFFDGEGCTWIHSRANTEGRHTGMSIGMQVSQSSFSNEEPPIELVRFKKAVLGVGRYGKRNEARKENYKYSWDWRVSTWVETQAVGALLFSFWSQTKQEQFLTAIKQFQTSPSWGRKPGNPNAKTMVSKRWEKKSE